METRSLLATITVTSLQDNLELDGQVTLREAIHAANTDTSVDGSVAGAGKDIIQFAPSGVGAGPHTIRPRAPLPVIFEPLIIDGTRTAGYDGLPLIELDGSQAGLAAGLFLRAGQSTVRGLAINGFSASGILIVGGGGNLLEANLIGTDLAGLHARPNAGSGVNIVNSAGNTIGGTTIEAGNVISGNRYMGISISGAVSTGNRLVGNRIGTNVLGDAAIPNRKHGVAVSQAPGNTIGGLLEGSRNTISGNAISGIRLVGSNATGTVIQGNFVGLDVTGSESLGGQQVGLDVRSPRNKIGGSELGSQNVISGNMQQGVVLSGANSEGNRIEGNRIGTDAAAETAIANGKFGLLISNSPNNIIGGSVADAGNVISGNVRQGVLIAGPGATHNVIAGNWIGTNPSADIDLGNGHSGVLIVASDNRIGGTAEESGNVIAHNRRGVWVKQGTGNAIQQNAIFAHAGLDIDLGASGRTPNDADDSDRGGNLQQNAPLLSGNPRLQPGGQLEIRYEVSSDPQHARYPLRIEFFLADARGSQAAVWLGADEYTSNDREAGWKTAEFTLHPGLLAMRRVLATATDADGNTSEFSARVPVDFSRPAITGVLFTDANGNGVLDPGESGQQDRTIRLDEPETVTAVVGGAPYVNPADLAVRPDGKYVVADLVPARVLLVDPETGHRSIISDKGLLQQAFGVALDSAGNILLIDPLAKAVFKIDATDGSQEVLSSHGELSHPTGIAIEADGRILVSDSGGGTILRIHPLTGDQEVVSAGGQLVAPQDVSVGTDGRIYVVDSGARKVIRIDPVDGTQVVIASGDQLMTPVSLALAPSGEIFVSDRTQTAILRIDPVTGVQEIAAQSSQFVDPRGMAFDAFGDLLVADRYAASSEGSIFRIVPRKMVAELATTDAGEFAFTDLAAREYEIRVTQPSGWLATTPNPLSVLAAKGLKAPQLELGSFATTTVGGTNFDDRDRDGVRDRSEPGLAGWTVFLDRNGNGAWNIDEPSSVTDVNGDYRLYDIGPGNYQLVAQQQVGWNRTDLPVTIHVDRSDPFVGVDLANSFGLAMAETGTIATLDETPTTVFLTGTYDRPVVFAHHASTPNADSSSMLRILDVQANQFTIRLDVSSGAGGVPAGESVQYFVLEAGLWSLADGTLIEVGTIETSANVGDPLEPQWTELEFSSPFLQAPVLQTQIQSSHGTEFVTSRTSAATSRGALVALDPGAESTVPHVSEIVGWLARESSAPTRVWENFIEQEEGDLRGTPQTPNVIVISIDDLNDWIGALGGYAGTVHTPNLDSLFGDGANFDNAIAPSAECSPSRTSVLTGLNPTTTRILRNGTHWLDTVPDAVTMPAYFRQHGYYTVAVSKLFHQQPNEGDPAAWNETYTSGRQFLPDDWSAIGQVSGIRFGGVDAPLEEFQDYRTASNAVNFLQSAPEAPFFLGMGIIDPHLQWIAPQEYFDLYPLEEIVLPEVPADDLDDLPQFALDNINNTFHANSVLKQDAWANLVQAYLAEISFADAMVGRVLDALEESPYGRNTIVAVWSDHGYHLGEKMHWNKSTLWEETLRVPLGIAGPNVAGGTVVEDVVSLVDLYPTLVELAGLPPNPNLDGTSLVGTLDGTDSPSDRPAVASYKLGQAVRSNEWAYIRYLDGSEELYDMQVDPGQFVNLASHAPYATVLAEMRGWLVE